jgi:hypothetical protein
MKNITLIDCKDKTECGFPLCDCQMSVGDTKNILADIKKGIEKAEKHIKMVNFLYMPVPIEVRLPELMKFVPVIDEDGEIAIYRRTEHGWNMRDGMGDNSPNNNKKIIFWLEKQPFPKFDLDGGDLIYLKEPND